MKNEHIWEEVDAIAFIDDRRNSHEGFNAFIRFESDAANQCLWCVGRSSFDETISCISKHDPHYVVLSHRMCGVAGAYM